MVFKEVKGDVLSAFENTPNAALVHCISADYALGAGIAKEINNRYDTRKFLQAFFKGDRLGQALFVNGVYNLVTKERYFQKPTIAFLKQTLNDLKVACEENNTHILVMPRIGCGLDRLSWPAVRDVIQQTFQDTDIDITVYSL